MKNDQQKELHITIANAIRGETLAQRRLFDGFYPYVMSIALRYMHSRSEAEEVVNDTFLKIFKGLEGYDTQLPFKAWVRKIAVNTCIDKLRSLKNRLKFLFLGEWDVPTEDVEMPMRLDRVPILPILQKLPPKYRIVFNLYVFEELKHKEIAELLGIAEGTSKSNYSRAKAILKRLLEKEHVIPTAKLMMMMSTIFG